jgi:hypothetical protein
MVVQEGTMQKNKFIFDQIGFKNNVTAGLEMSIGKSVPCPIGTKKHSSVGPWPQRDLGP